MVGLGTRDVGTQVRSEPTLSQCLLFECVPGTCDFLLVFVPSIRFIHVNAYVFDVEVYLLIAREKDTLNCVGNLRKVQLER